MGNFDVLEARGISRRDFVKMIAAVTAAFGLPEVIAPKAAQAVEAAAAKPPVIWLHGMECTGCTCSVISTLNPSVEELVLDMLSLRYQETIMAGQGTVSEKALDDTVKNEAGKYVLIVEGSIPAKEDRYCKVGGKAFKQTVLDTAKSAAVVIAIGSCATDGAGVPGACATGAIGVRDLFKQENVDIPVINLPCCPVKPTTVIGTLVYYLTTKQAPPLDDQARPLAYYGKLLHDNCPRRGRFENGEFLEDWNDPDQKDFCLLLKGCKGPKTYTDCAQVWFNDNVNFCINAGSPCAGCSEKDFYKEFTPLYAKQENFPTPGLAGISTDTVGKVVGGVAAVGFAAHLVGNIASGRLKEHYSEDSEHGSKEENK